MARERVRQTVDAEVETKATAHSTYTQNGVITTDWYPKTYGTEGSEEYETTVDVVTEDFARKIARGDIINNDYSHHITRTNRPGPVPFYFKLTEPGGARYWIVEGDFHGNASAPPSLVDPGVRTEEMSALAAGVYSLAVTQAHANIDESSMLALAAIAESGKTIDSVTSISYRAYKIFKAVKRLDLKYLRKQISAKELQQRYMEARYAIRPLMYDAAGIMNALEQESRNVRQTYRGSASDSLSGTGPVVTGKHCIDKLYCSRRNEWTYTVSARAGVLCDVAISRVQIWGADKVLETLWELAPWSFVVDWFINVGDSLAAMTPNAGVKQRASWVTVKETFTSTDVYSSPTIIGSSWPSSCTMNDFSSKRFDELITRTADPTLSVFPSVDIGLSSLKLIDLGIMLKRMIF